MTDISATIEQGSVDDRATGSSWLPRLAAVLAALAVILAFEILRLGTSGDIRFRLGLDVTSIAPVMTTLLFPLIGALIVQRRPTTRVAWLMGIGLGLGFIAGHGVIRAILVGPRVDGRPHDPRTVAQLEDTAGLVATALDLRRPADA
jgi:hypothetical protein